MNHWNWSETFPDYSDRMKYLAFFIETRFHAHRVDSLSLVPKGWDYV